MKQKARLEEWCTTPTFDGKLLLRGKVYGHPLLIDGDFIYTTEIVKVHKEKGIVETLNTLYTLGKPLDKEPNYN